MLGPDVVKRLPFSVCVQMFFKVFNGYRPPIPQGMPKGLADLMTAAWSHTPEERPSYRFIVKALQRLIREVCLKIAPICLLLPLFMCCRRRVRTWHLVVHPHITEATDIQTSCCSAMHCLPCIC